MFRVIDVRPTSSGQNIDVVFTDGHYEYIHSYPPNIEVDKILQRITSLDAMMAHSSERARELRKLLGVRPVTRWRIVRAFNIMRGLE